MGGLEDVGGVQVVVVGVAVPVVANFQVTKEALQHRWRDLVLVAAPVLVQQVVSWDRRQASGDRRQTYP